MRILHGLIAAICSRYGCGRAAFYTGVVESGDRLGKPASDNLLTIGVI